MTSGNFLDRNESLQLAIRSEFPNTYKMMQYNPKGTFLYLKKKEAIEANKTHQHVGVEITGDNNYKAWSDYLTAVEKHLDGINPDKRLKRAKLIIADKIKTEHYRKYKHWPKPGTTQTAVIDITCNGGYRYLDSRNMNEADENGHYIAYSCEGSVSVEDRCEKPKTGLFLGWIAALFGHGGSGTKRTYFTTFHGNPIIKVIIINLLALTMFEKAAIKQPEKIKKQIDKAFEQNKQKKLKLWETFGEDSGDDTF